MDKASYDIDAGGRTRRVEVRRLPADRTGPLYEVRVDGGPPQVVSAVRPVEDVLSLLVDGACWEAGLVPREDGFEVELLGVRHEVEVHDPKRKALRMAGGGSAGAQVVARMPGRVVRVLVGVGDAVAKGQPLLVLEAMKMENELKAPAAGTVRSVQVAVGDLVETKAVLLELG
jgi:biotin carboxyl carrier protein